MNIQEIVQEIVRNRKDTNIGVPLYLNEYAALCRKLADSFYHDINTGEKIEKNPGEAFMLAVSELSEAYEGLRKDKQDDHLPHLKSVEVETADALIREFDFSGDRNLDLDTAFWEKLAYNQTRKDHTHEERRKKHGKKW